MATADKVNLLCSGIYCLGPNIANCRLANSITLPPAERAILNPTPDHFVEAVMLVSIVAWMLAWHWSCKVRHVLKEYTVLH